MDQHRDGLSGPERRWAVVSVALAIGMTVLDSSIANVALPVIARDFGARPSESIWIVNAYQLAIVVSLLPLASLGEIVGFRRVYYGRPGPVHGRLPGLRPVARPDLADRRPRAAGVRGGGGDERQRRARTVHLAEPAARSRHRRQRPGGLGHRGDRAAPGLGHPEPRPVAMAVRGQHPRRARGPHPGLAPAAGQSAVRPALRHGQRHPERPDLRAGDHRGRHRHPHRRQDPGGPGTRGRARGRRRPRSPRMAAAPSAGAFRPAAGPHLRLVGRNLDRLLRRPVAGDHLAAVRIRERSCTARRSRPAF